MEGNLSAHMSYLPLFNKLRLGVFVTRVSQPRHTVLQGFSLPGVICSVQGGGSEDLRGERSRGRSLPKNAARPKGQTSGLQGGGSLLCKSSFLLAAPASLYLLRLGQK